ncbi:PIG-L deacetylase family protein [Algoriphagus namhaensis]
MKKRWIFALSGLLLLLLMSPFLLILVGRNVLHDFFIPQRVSLLEENQPQRVLAFFPHPDDEITVAGTLARLKNEGHQIYLVVLTKGEAGSSPENYDEQTLAAVRETEMQASAQVLGVDQLYLGEYPDGGLQDIGLDSLMQVAATWIDELQPTILISYDSKVGLYGHEDHRLTGDAIESLFKSRVGEDGFSPERLYQVTLSPKQIQVALKLSKGFQDNYPTEPEKGLPEADFSVDVQPFFFQKLEAMQAHHSQRLVLRDLMPYHDQIPAWIYSRIFDREYFAEVK